MHDAARREFDGCICDANRVIGIGEGLHRRCAHSNGHATGDRRTAGDLQKLSAI
jgi:hypothetical protein